MAQGHAFLIWNVNIKNLGCSEVFWYCYALALLIGHSRAAIRFARVRISRSAPAQRGCRRASHTFALKAFARLSSAPCLSGLPPVKSKISSLLSRLRFSRNGGLERFRAVRQSSSLCRHALTLFMPSRRSLDCRRLLAFWVYTSILVA